MEINQLEHFKCLLEKGKPLDALLPLFLYVKKANLIENFSDTESTNKAQNLSIHQNLAYTQAFR